MAREQFYVSRNGDAWDIVHNGHHSGLIASQQGAVEQAIRAAARSDGDSRVLLQDWQGAFRVIWTFGNRGTDRVG